MKIISLMPVRNEAWILERTLRVLSTFCDHIIVADQLSTDGTRTILSKFPEKVTVIDNPNVYWSETIREKLLGTARDFDGNNFIICTDADEIISTNIRNDNILEALTKIKPGFGIKVPFYNLWKSSSFYRNDSSVWSNAFVGFGFRDDRILKYNFTSIGLHQGRFPNNTQTKILLDLKLIHYQFVIFARKRSKECWYRTLELMQLGSDHIPAINYSYRVARDERDVRLSPLDPEWLIGWQNLGIDLHHFQEEPLYWYDVEVLRYFSEKGTAYFASLDIWDLDWEAKRRLALAQGYEGIPQEPIVDPRTWEQKCYHAYLARFQRTPCWRDPSELLWLVNQGMRRTAKTFGLKRYHLEHLGLLSPKEAVRSEEF